MDENMLRFLMAAGFIAATLAIAAISGELSSYRYSDPLDDYYHAYEYGSVTLLLDEMPIDSQVSLTGTVSSLGEDYVSKGGNEYMQFYVSDGSSEVKVICLKGRDDPAPGVGDSISLTGRFQKYYETLEIYTECADIRTQ